MKIGSRYSFTHKGRLLEGVLLKQEGGKVTIKLSSGYNISIQKTELKNSKELKAKKKVKAASPKRISNSKLPKISILHTGGTIASKIDYDTGAVVPKFSDKELLELFPELSTIGNFRTAILGNMLSENMRFAHWNIIINAVAKEIKSGAKGIIITHGTDILHMSAAAVAFGLENLSIPVLFVASQRSSDRPSSDSASNIIQAAAFLSKNPDFQGVGICMHEDIVNDNCIILPACRSRKMHTSRRDAFKAINDQPYARISYPELTVEKISQFPQSEGKLIVKLFKEKLKIGLLHLHPHLHLEELQTYRKFDGLVLSLLGIGHAPTMVTDKHNKENKAHLAEITTLAKKLVVVGAPQTIYGRVNMNVYTPGRQLLDAGVLGQNLDMTPETAFVKLAWLLSNHSKKETKELYSQNLRGEISERSEEREFDL